MTAELEPEEENEDSIAATVVYYLNAPGSLGGHGWTIVDQSLGEITINCPHGQKFRLTVEEVVDDP